MTISSVKFNVTITWVNESCEGRFITRVWTGPDDRYGEIRVSKSGDTERGRNQEIEALLSHNKEFGHDWAVS